MKKKRFTEEQIVRMLRAGSGSRSDGGPGVQGKRHFGTDVVSLEEQVRPDGRGGGASAAGAGEGKRPAQADCGRARPGN